VPEGESYADVEKKVAAWMSELSGDKIVLAVTHSVVSRVIRAMFLQLEKHNAGMLEHPQNTIFRLIEGQIDTIRVCQ
jgi:broad specificity phosphatase PhoE